MQQIIAIPTRTRVIAHLHVNSAKLKAKTCLNHRYGIAAAITLSIAWPQLSAHTYTNIVASGPTPKSISGHRVHKN